MLFNSLHFCLFLPIVTTFYYIVPHSYAWFVLLIASCYFYMSWQPFYILLIGFATVLNYFLSIAIEDADNPAMKKAYLYCAVVCTLGILFIFKYLDFFYQALHHGAYAFGFDFEYTPFGLTLPVGISFFTFQTMSYTLDVFWGKQKAERHFGKFALFVTYFPQLVAGPIERASNLLIQFDQRKPFSYENASFGLRTFLGGMILKIVVADNLARYVDAVYNNVYDYIGWPLLFATYLFAFQIFCDFAGYSYMAIGIARIMGINLMENFRQPYLAASIRDFWRRWHISLSTWFSDYVYLPLGGNRVPLLRYNINIIITFLISGLWHGSNWTFIIWGALHAFYMLSAFYIPDSLVKKLPYFFKVFITFSLTCFAWIFFRANSLADASYILNHMFVGMFDWSTLLQLRRPVVIGRSFDIISLVMLTLGVWIVHIIQQYIGHIRYNLSRVSQFLRIILYYVSIAGIFLLGEFGGHQFIYFQF